MNKLISHLTTSTRLRAVGFSTMLFLLLLPVAPASALATTGITKICPPADETANVDTTIGQIWGYADRYGKYIALAGVVILIVAIATKARGAVLFVVIGISALLVLAPIIIGAVENLPGTC